MSVQLMFLAAIGFSLDAFGVAANRGTGELGKSKRDAVICGAWFAGVQFVAVLLGCLFGILLRKGIKKEYGYGILAVVLLLVGLNALRNVFFEKPDEAAFERTYKNTWFFGAITGIDGFFAGISLALLKSGIFQCSFRHFNIWIAGVLFALVTFGMAVLGMRTAKTHPKLRKRVILTGALVLLLADLIYLLEHLGVLPYIL